MGCCDMDMLPPFAPGPMLPPRGAGLGAPPGADIAIEPAWKCQAAAR